MKLNIKKIKLNDHNPRDITPEMFEKLKKSIQEFPQMLDTRPLVIDENNVVLGGNMRLRALTDLGYEEIPVQKVEGWSEEQKKEFIIKDNVSYGVWDWELLANQWDAEQLEDWGLEVQGWEEEKLEAQEDNFEVPDEIQTDIQLGDIIEIGEHRLMCGDSTDSDQVTKLMNGEKADLAHNDPPYGMKKEKDGVLNDNLNYNDLLEFNKQWIPLQFAYLKDNGSFYCWGIDEPLMDIYSEILKPYIKTQKATFRNLITWDKGHGQGQNSENTRSYAIADEKCLFVMCGVQGFNTNADNYFEGWENIRLYLEAEAKKVGLNGKKLKEITGVGMYSHWFTKSQWTLIPEEHYKKIQNAFKKEYDAFEKEYEELKKEYEELKKEYYSTRAYFNNTHDNFNNVWHFERHTKQGDEGEHATPKPIPLCERVIKSSCPENGLVLDFFLGSGSTMVASHQLGRKCYGMELDPKYCQVIVDRMKKLDPELVIKINGNTVN
jgi:DNA modification methylase